MFKTILKITLWILLALLIALGVAYWTAPSWVPGHIQKFLPPSIKLDQLQLQHPGLTSTKVDSVTIIIGETNSGETDSDTPKYRLQLTNTQIYYSLWQQKITSISAEKARIIMPESASNSKTAERDILQQIPLPIIPLPTIPVPKLDVTTIEIEGITLGTITAKNLVLEEQNSHLSVNTTINFFDHDFTITAKAERDNESLGNTTLNIQQSNNHIKATIKPINSLHWAFEVNSNINSQDYHSQPGLSTLELNLNGSVDITNPNKVAINLEPNNTILTSLNIQKLGLQQSLISTLQAQNINTNLKSFEPVYSLLLTNKTASTIEYSAETSLISLTQGDLALTANNPSIQLESIINKLSLNLNNELTAPSQHISAVTKATIKNLKADYTTPTNKASAASVDVQLAATANLEQGQLKVSSDNSRIALSTVHYEGNNSTATVSSSDWLIQGSSNLDLTLDQTESTSAQHDWQVTSKKPIDAVLTLSAEQFNAQQVSINLGYKTTIKRPKGTTHGSYRLAKLSLKQQPLQLSDLKGNLLFAPEISPLSGSLSFSSAQYKNQQVGISNIAGKLDWTKKTNRFVAQGKLVHNDSNVPFTYQFDLENSRHNLKIKQSSLPISTVTSWVKILKDYPELSFNSGQLEINSLDGDPIGLLFDGNIKLDNFNLNYDEFYVKNWSIEDSLTSSSKLGGTLKSHIDRIELATDIAITDVSFLMPHTINSLVITNLMGKLLKGSIEIPTLAINEQGIPPFTAYLKGVDIGALLKALNSEKLQIQGLFDFTLPLSISDEGQQIINGKFEALGTGVIKLKSDGKDPNIAFQALENFHYKEFSGTVNYNLEGNYTIELHVLGSNPDLYSGFPVKLDLTLRGELPNLLYSMLVTGDMTKPILDDLEQKQILNIQP